jgi:nicotinamide riboside kinase
LRRPRLALSGSAGTGKSTLGRALAARLDVPYLPEGMRLRIEAGLDLHAISHAGLRDLLLDLWQEQRAWEAEAEACGFVADRSSVDFAAFWLHYRFGEDPSAAAFCGETLDHARRYDQIVLLPWGVLPLVADGVRSSNPWVQRHYQATVEGLLFREVEPARLAVMPPLQALEARVAWIEARLGDGIASDSSA